MTTLTDAQIDAARNRIGPWLIACIVAFALGVISGSCIVSSYETDAAWCNVLGRVPVWTMGSGLVCEVRP